MCFRTAAGATEPVLARMVKVMPVATVRTLEMMVAHLGCAARKAMVDRLEVFVFQPQSAGRGGDIIAPMEAVDVGQTERFLVGITQGCFLRS